MSQSVRHFVVSQPFLGSALHFSPMGKELDELIDDYVPGTQTLQQKKGQVSLQFLNAVDHNTQFPARIRYAVPPKATLASASNPATSVKRSRDNFDSSNAPTAKRLPGFSIMTKDGQDITEYASRGPKTKEQRDHAALMRRLKACPACKKSKQRCDPGHHGISTVSATLSSFTSYKTSVSGRSSVASQSSGSRTSASPQSGLELSFGSMPCKFGSLAHTGKRFSPYERPASSFSASDYASVSTMQPDYIQQRRLALLKQQARIDAELAALTTSQFLVPAVLDENIITSYGVPRTSTASFDQQPLTEFLGIDESLYVPGLEHLASYISTSDTSYAAPSTYPDVESSAYGFSSSSSIDCLNSPRTSVLSSGRPISPLSQLSSSQSQPDFDLDQWVEVDVDGLERQLANEPILTAVSPDKCFFVNGKPFDHNEKPVDRSQDFIVYPEGNEIYWAVDPGRDPAETVENGRNSILLRRRSELSSLHSNSVVQWESLFQSASIVHSEAIAHSESRVSEVIARADSCVHSRPAVHSESLAQSESLEHSERNPHVLLPQDTSVSPQKGESQSNLAIVSRRESSVMLGRGQSSTLSTRSPQLGIRLDSPNTLVIVDHRQGSMRYSDSSHSDRALDIKRNTCPLDLSQSSPKQLPCQSAYALGMSNKGASWLSSVRAGGVVLPGLLTIVRSLGKFTARTGLFSRLGDW